MMAILSALPAYAQGLADAGASVFLIVIVIIGILASIFWLWMLIDCLTSSLPTGEKVLWFLVILFLHLLGALLYLVLARGRRGGVGPAA